MNAPRSSVPSLLAPGASSTAAYAPGRHDRLPAVDERLVAPESRAEILDGRVIHTMGSNQPHGTRHFEATGLFYGVLADGYAGAVDMLTRADDDTDAAPDISVFPEAPDAMTGGRQLEEIAVEVLDTERMAHATAKVRKFAARGVRRLFAIRVPQGAVYEWDHARDDWNELDANVVITDRCFRVPVPMRAFVDRVAASTAIARALVERKHPVVVEAVDAGRAAGLRDGRAEGRASGLQDGRAEGLRDGRAEGLRDGRAEGLRDGRTEGRAEGLREALRAFVAAAGIALDAADEARIDACGDAATLRRWIANARTATSAESLFA